jgi:uncharacterized protein involved in exopolysaccharide biosynthesis
MSESAWIEGAEAPPPFRLGPTAPARPSYLLGDYVTLLWRERTLMLGVFLAVLAVGLAATFALKTVYPVQASLLIRLGQEYVYEPSAGDAARGVVPDADQVVQSEVEILSSAQLKQRVIEKIGIGRLFPSFAAHYDTASPDRQRLMMARAIAAVERDLKVAAAPDTPVVRISYQHPDPDMAALALNTLLDEYLIYRRSILLDPTAPLDAQRRAFESRLAQADEAYEDFLGSNNIGDFEAEKASLGQLQAGLQQQKYANDAQLQDRQGRLGALDAQAGQIAPEIGLYRDVDHTGQDKLNDLKLQREALLSRYKPDATPVHELDVQIAGLEHALSSGRVQGDGARRVGLNPVFQTVETDRIQLTAEVAALQSASAALGHQIDEVTQRQLRLASLEPQYQGLSRDRDVLQNNVKDFTIKEETSQAAEAIASQSNDNISIVQRAVAPVQGKSLKRPVLALSLLMAALGALCVGLLRIFLRSGFPIAAAASRALDLPVLASAGVKRPGGR